MNFSQLFANFSRTISAITGQPRAFVFSVFLVFAWFISGPFFEFSDTWQLVINTGTTIVTFLMVFLIQNTQNRDSMAVQIKLDELIRVQEGTHNALLDLEELTEEQLIEISAKYRRLAHIARKNIEQGKKDTNAAEV